MKKLRQHSSKEAIQRLKLKMKEMRIKKEKLSRTNSNFTENIF
jgi:hypothetical protein